MRPRQSRLGIPATEKDWHGVPPSFNEAEAITPRNPSVECRSLPAVTPASMRPRQSRLGIVELSGVAFDSNGTRFNEAEAITPRNPHGGMAERSCDMALQ